MAYKTIILIGCMLPSILCNEWVDLDPNTECDAGAGEVYRKQSPGKVSDLAACKKSCEDDASCKSITFFLDKWCSHFSTACTRTKVTDNAISLRRDATPPPAGACPFKVDGYTVECTGAYTPLSFGDTNIDKWMSAQDSEFYQAYDQSQWGNDGITVLVVDKGIPGDPKEYFDGKITAHYDCDTQFHKDGSVPPESPCPVSFHATQEDSTVNDVHGTRCATLASWGTDKIKIVDLRINQKKHFPKMEAIRYVLNHYKETGRGKITAVSASLMLDFTTDAGVALAEEFGDVLFTNTAGNIQKDWDNTECERNEKKVQNWRTCTKNLANLHTFGGLRQKPYTKHFGKGTMSISLAGPAVAIDSLESKLARINLNTYTNNNYQKKLDQFHDEHEAKYEANKQLCEQYLEKRAAWVEFLKDAGCWKPWNKAGTSYPYTIKRLKTACAKHTGCTYESKKLNGKKLPPSPGTYKTLSKKYKFHGPPGRATISFGDTVPLYPKNFPDAKNNCEMTPDKRAEGLLKSIEPREIAQVRADDGVSFALPMLVNMLVKMKLICNHFDWEKLIEIAQETSIKGFDQDAHPNLAGGMANPAAAYTKTLEECGVGHGSQGAPPRELLFHFYGYTHL